MISTAIMTISDSCSQNRREDISGRTIRETLPSDKFEVHEYNVVADDKEQIMKHLRRLADEAGVDIVFTTGGTGLGPRDVTPEATAAVCDRIIPGLTEAMRFEGQKTARNAMLSRSVAGMRKKTLIINLPGSSKAVAESLEIILDVLPHAVDMISGGGHE